MVIRCTSILRIVPAGFGWLNYQYFNITMVTFFSPPLFFFVAASPILRIGAAGFGALLRRPPPPAAPGAPFALSPAASGDLRRSLPPPPPAAALARRFAATSLSRPSGLTAEPDRQPDLPDWLLAHCNAAQLSDALNILHAVELYFFNPVDKMTRFRHNPDLISS